MSFQCCKTTSILVSHVLIYNALCSQVVLVGIESILAELYSSLKLNPDSTSEQSATYDQLMRSPLIVRCLSAQYALGSRGERPTISAKIAWVAINLKFTSLAFHYAINHINHVAEASQPGIHTASLVQELPFLTHAIPELPDSLIGVIKWWLDMAGMIIDDVLSLARAIKGKEGDREAIHAHSRVHRILLYSHC